MGIWEYNRGNETAMKSHFGGDASRKREPERIVPRKEAKAAAMAATRLS
jgi:hypothetical protein